MDNSKPHLPSCRALVALERVARLGNITRAAEELHTSQAAISRHIRQLESNLGVTLLSRDGRGIKLTAVGDNYAQDITEALHILRKAGERASSNNNELSIACTHEVSHLILMPRYAALKKALGKQIHIRIVTCDYKAMPDVIDAGADIVFEYRRSVPHGHAVKIVPEEIVPAASPDFLANNKKLSNKNPEHWKDIARLSLTKENSGWASWEDWFASQHTTIPPAPEQTFDNYVYALEAATRAEGLVLAWRGFADRYFESGQLLPIRQEWLKSGSVLYATETKNGQAKQLTKKCLQILSELPHIATN